MHYTPDWLKEIQRLPDFDLSIQCFGGHHQWVPQGWKADKERHLAFEIMVILKGVQQTKYDYYSTEYRAGDIVIIPPGRVHENQCVSQEGLEYFCMHFYMDDMTVQQRLLLYCPDKLDRLNPCFLSIHHTVYQLIQLIERYDDSIRMKLQLELLLIQLVIDLQDYSVEAEHMMEYTMSHQANLARDIAEMIQYRFTESISTREKQLLSIEKIAQEMMISHSTMLKTFKSVYGMSPKQYLEWLKFNQAKQLLKQPGMTVSDVSEGLAYPTVAQFSRQFKKWSGLSPKQYQMHQG